MGEYRHGERTTTRRIRADIVITGIIFFLLLIGGLYLYFDSRNSLVVGDINNRPQVLQVQDQQREVTVIEEDDFRVELPGAWTVSPPNFQAERGSRNERQFHYKSIGETSEGRLFDVFVDTLPANENVSKLMKSRVEGDTIIGAEISPQCRSFTKFDKVGQIVTSKWQSIEFECNTSEFMNTIGVADSDFSDGVVLTGEDGVQHVFMIIYTDHSRNPSNTLLTEILTSFKAL